jgi:hypothetical protein
MTGDNLLRRIWALAECLPPVARNTYMDATVAAQLDSAQAMAMAAQSTATVADAYRPSLCFRCEERARYLEFGHAARYECGCTGRAVRACYCYRPVAPMVQAPLAGDGRPIGAPWMLAPRCEAKRVAAGHTELRRMRGREHVMVFVCEEGKP